MPDLCGNSQPQLRELFDVMDSLRKVAGSVEMSEKSKITIPQIAVVGNQSVGKSSLLELLSGFRLPIGTDIVTRCPILLRIRNAAKPRVVVDGMTIDFADVGNAISKAQDRLIDSEAREQSMGKDVCEKAVETLIEGPDKRDLTLIDLPGIQYSNTDLTVKIKRMIMKYIESDATIILLIMQSTSDPTTTEALHCARTVDPDCKRTVCVLTKPDEVPADDKAKQDSLISLMKGSHNQLKFPNGVFVVKARASHQNDLDIEQVRSEEKKYFSSHAAFSVCLDIKKAGYENLFPAVEAISLRFMKENLPTVMKQVEEILDSKKREFKMFDGHTVLQTYEDRSRVAGRIFAHLESSIDVKFQTEGGKICSPEQFQKDVIYLLQDHEEQFKTELEKNVFSERDHLRSFGVANESHFNRTLTEIVDNIKPLAMHLCDETSDSILHSILERSLSEIGNAYNMAELIEKVIKEVFENQKELSAKRLTELFEYQKVPYLSELDKHYGPSVTQLRGLQNFTMNDKLAEVERNMSLTNGSDILDSMETKVLSQDPSPLKDEHISLSTENLTDEKKKKSKDKKKGSSNLADVYGSTMSLASSGTSPSSNQSKGLFGKMKHKFNKKRDGEAYEKLAKDVNVPESMRNSAMHLTNEYNIMIDNLLTHAYLTAFSLISAVVKIVTFHLMWEFKEKLKSEFYGKKESFVDLVTEDPEMKARYEQLDREIGELKTCLGRLRTVHVSLR